MRNLKQQKILIESSAEYWPNHQKLRDQLSIPITISLCPLQLSQHQNIASFSSTDSINQYRCHSCKAFINNLCTLKKLPQKQSSNKYHLYDCSICGCTNRLPKAINKNAPQLSSSVYYCTTQNPSNRIIHINANNTKPTLAFVVDISLYGNNGLQTKRFIQYASTVITNFIKDINREQKQGECIQDNKNNGNNEGDDEKSIQKQLKFNVLILTFDRSLNQYYLEDDQICKIINTHNEQISFNKPQKSILKTSGAILKILADIIANNQTDTYKNCNSQAFLPALQAILIKTSNLAGKIFFISGIRHSPGKFHRGLFDQPEDWRQNYEVNKKKCIPPNILALTQKTQMSLHFYIYNSTYINLMPLYVLAKSTNGCVRHYNCVNDGMMFYYQFHHDLYVESQEITTEAILKVRVSSGLKLAGIFGQYRNYKGFNDQIELLSCTSSRKYIFQFSVQGRIQQPSIATQFSILYTDIQGNRVFKIVTHNNKVTSNQFKILSSINYTNVNSSYLHAILHNMDTKMRTRSLQITLQDRCQKHFKQLKKYTENRSKQKQEIKIDLMQEQQRQKSKQKQGNQIEDIDLIKRSSQYSMFTYLLLRHYLMNTKHSQTITYQKLIDLKSRMLTTDQHAIHAIWPAIYSISSDQIQVIEMKQKQIIKAKTAIVIDQGDNCHLFIVDPKIRRQILDYINKGRDIDETVSEVLRKNEEISQEYEKVIQKLEEIKLQKITQYARLMVLDSVEGLALLDQKGPLGYDSFLSAILG